MDIFLNITFPRMPCELLTLDVMDVSGEQQHGIAHGVHKVRLRPESEGGGEIDKSSLNLHEEVAEHMDPDYCGSCGGAPAPASVTKAGCCNTCEEIREAYAQVSWAFGDGRAFEQCQREHYAEKLEEQRREGCRIDGTLQVNKVVGNFHLAPGRSFSNGNMHVHDLKNYWDVKDGQTHDFTHTIHTLRFGPKLPREVYMRLGKSGSAFADHNMDALDGLIETTKDPNFNYMYFVKIVPTSFLPLGWESTSGNLGRIETNQYSVTKHRRSLSGGDDSAEGHSERLHSRGGIPGVFFSYVSCILVIQCQPLIRNANINRQDISPMKVINREAKSKGFLGFVAGVCAVVGGTLTVAAAIDRGLFEGANRMKKLRSKDL